MKVLTVILMLAVLMWGCGSANTEEEASQMEEQTEHMAEGDHGHESEEWTEAEDFHSILALTYHPMEDEGKIEAVSENAAELLQKAEAWAASTVPGQFDEAEFSSELDALVEDAGILVELVDAEASEEELKEQVYVIHDRFHMLEGKLSGGEHMHEESGE